MRAPARRSPGRAAAMRAGRTRAAARIFRTISPESVASPGSTLQGGLASTSTAPASIARIAVSAPSGVVALMTTTGIGRTAITRPMVSMASPASMPSVDHDRVGRLRVTARTTSSASAAIPTTSSRGSAASVRRRAPASLGNLPPRALAPAGPRARSLGASRRSPRGYQPRDQCHERALVHRLGDVVLHPQPARELEMLVPRPRGENDHRQRLRVSGRRRRSWTSSKPLTRGISRSVTTTSTSPSARRFNASPPSAAIRTRKPARSSTEPHELAHAEGVVHQEHARRRASWGAPAGSPPGPARPPSALRPAAPRRGAWDRAAG